MFLAQTKIETNIQDNKGNTPLHIAVRGSKAALVQSLLNKKGTMVDFSNKEGFTPLILAAKEGFIGIVKLLLVAKAKVDNMTHEGETALDWAKKNGHIEIERILQTYETN